MLNLNSAFKAHNASLDIVQVPDSQSMSSVDHSTCFLSYLTHFLNTPSLSASRHAVYSSHL